jgi:predicted RNA binding protein YcfA (HicA-like mRNA interferase family)
MKSREVIKALRAAGFEQVRQKGSHVQFKHPSRKSLVTVPHPRSELPVGLMKSIERQSGLKLI